MKTYLVLVLVAKCSMDSAQQTGGSKYLKLYAKQFFTATEFQSGVEFRGEVELRWSGALPKIS
jgi:hypothetical protein